MRKPFRHFRHAVLLLRRTIRANRMLSVTVVLSLSLLLGFLLYTDTTNYHRYAQDIVADRHYVVTGFVGDAQERASCASLFRANAEKIGNTVCYEYFLSDRPTDITQSRFETSYGAQVAKIPQGFVYGLPRHTPSVRNLYYGAEIQWLDGQEHEDIDLQSGQILLEEPYFRLLGLDKVENPTYRLSMEGVYLGEFAVVGTVASDTEYNVSGDVNAVFIDAGMAGTVVYVSLSDIPQAVFDQMEWRQFVITYTDDPHGVSTLASTFEEHLGNYWSNADGQDAAFKAMREASEKKSMIAALLLLILGINLYACFVNALNDRKFEIGVKRALGAGKWSIVRQFLYESLLIMALDTLISVWVVSAAGAVYKYVMERTPDEWGDLHQYTLYLTPFSIAMFAVCAVALTVVFSLIFAYKSTQVQVVDYLKAE